ncbi:MULTISPECIES: ATP-binding protein [unclassified Breznakia]|uniref:ATP-binding protein n=1 Tax=unclassified Breznakia TaxID=2623764 RepID=UPI0024763019|nr:MULTISPECIES: ATP-binding protein [unclassified Breznakia]MDH6367528.1 hypothetical protein [Breznakia sp. PH1-1]MDH6404678.1 hypothetical protein [Breznakia sp. PF1-11]MDH6412358.1 hypothetical protein [Breznakia sp. PFB1-11]MDH6414696.1 hypothetical protein [Breznakia sp. PFB1-14]MDH6417059.1 hypothetical protein [Breznakia sp. PFB1-4]
MNITKGKIESAKKTVVYGPEGIGKSTLAAQWPDPLFIDTEGGTKSLDVARLDKPTSYTMLLQQIQFVKQNRPCGTLIIDTIDWAERLVTDFICQRANKTSITGFGYGEGFLQLEEEIGRLLNNLSDLTEIGIHVVLVAHAKINKFEQPDEMGAYDRYELKLGNKTTAKTASLVKEWADMVLFCNYKTISVATDDKGKKFKGQGGKRVIYTTHAPAWDAKNRDGLPDFVDMDYKNIAHVIKTFNVTPQVQPVAPPVTQQPSVQEVKQEPVQQAAPTEPPLTIAIDESDYVGLPQALVDLMKPEQVSKAMVEDVVSEKGYFPKGTPITNYPQEFIDGVLIAAWPQVLEMINEKRMTF